MYISNFKITNYKCFFDSNEIQLDTGFNSIVGKNNSGKTALLEALSLSFENKPHRSLKTLQHPEDIIEAQAICELTVVLTKNEFWRSIIKQRQNRVLIPYPPTHSKLPFNTFSNEINDINTFQFKLKGNVLDSGYLTTWGYHGFGNCFGVTPGKNLENPFKKIEFSVTQGIRYDEVILEELKKEIYFFKAERFNVGRFGFGPQTILTPNASNLPQVLNSLQARNRRRFDRLNSYVNEIFPEIQNVAVIPTKESELEIVIWSINPDTEREDLAIPLSESGTGVGQVIAILFVVMTSDSPRIFIIDEPQSFLHPGAIRKLMSILNEISKNSFQHQFIFGTHSTTVLNAADPNRIISVNRMESESACNSISINDTESMRIILSEIGVKLSDVFGADTILWVEGKTEELCFPKVIEQLCKNSLRGTQIISIYSTGDLSKKDITKVVRIYKKLSNGYSLVPPALGIILDIENRTLEQCSDLTRESNGIVKFIPRRMFENYLINPKGIKQLLSNILDSESDEIREDDIIQWLDNHKWNRKYFKRKITEDMQNNEVWFKKVHGANILKDLFKDISDNRVTYRKTEYGFALTKWVLKEATEDIKELVDFLDNIIGLKKVVDDQ